MTGWASSAWGNGSTRAWRTQRARALHRDEHTCIIQGPTCTHEATEVDHVINKAAGGTDNLDNLRAVCAPCHNTITKQQAAQGRQRRSNKRTPLKHPALG